MLHRSFVSVRRLKFAFSTTVELITHTFEDFANNCVRCVLPDFIVNFTMSSHANSAGQYAMPFPGIPMHGGAPVQQQGQQPMQVSGEDALRAARTATSSARQPLSSQPLMAANPFSLGGTTRRGPEGLPIR